MSVDLADLAEKSLRFHAFLPFKKNLTSEDDFYSVFQLELDERDIFVVNRFGLLVFHEIRSEKKDSAIFEREEGLFDLNHLLLDDRSEIFCRIGWFEEEVGEFDLLGLDMDSNRHGKIGRFGSEILHMRVIRL